MKLKIASNKLLKETFWSLLAKAAAFVFYFGLSIILARHLRPEKFGTWSYYYSIINMLLLLSYFGVNASARKFIAQYNNTDQLFSVMKTSIIIRVSFSILFALLFLFISRPLSIILGRPDFEALFLLSAPLIFFAGLVDFFRHAFEGLHRLKYVFFITLSEHGLKFIFSIVLLLITNGLTALIISFNLSLMFTSVLGLYYYYLFSRKPEIVKLNYDSDIIKYSIPLFFVTIGFAIAVELDVIMLGHLSLDSEVGIYAIAKQIIVKLPHFAVAISMGTTPVFAKLNINNKKELSVLFYQLMKTNTFIIGSLSLLILGTSWLFIPLIYGEIYKASIIPLMILVVYLLLFSYSIFLSIFLDYQGKAQKRAVNLSIAIALNILLNYILIPRFGAIGAAIGTSVSYIPYVYLNWLEVRRYLR